MEFPEQVLLLERSSSSNLPIMTIVLASLLGISLAVWAVAILIFSLYSFSFVACAAKTLLLVDDPISTRTTKPSSSPETQFFKS